MPIDPALKAKQNLYEDTVIHYMGKEDGHVIVLSDDQAFTTQLRLTLAKELGLSSPNMLTALSDPHQLLRVLREVTPKHPAPCHTPPVSLPRDQQQRRVAMQLRQLPPVA